MTLDEYLVNPLGKANAVMSTALREATKLQYSQKFDNILLRENGKINFYTYRDKKNNIYWIHVKVPSEVVPKFYYDVVFKFFQDSKVKVTHYDLKKWQVNFFSNDPAFVYTYENAYKEKGLIIKELIPKMSKTALKYKAKEKNPTELIYYSKILYFGILFCQQRDILTTTRLFEAPEYNNQQLLQNIEDTDKIIEKRQEEGNKISKKKKIEVDENTARKLKQYGILDGENAAQRFVMKATKVPTIKKTKAINKTKSIKKK